MRITSALALTAALFALCTSPALALDRHVIFENDSNSSITEIYANNVNDRYWSDNLLRGRIRPGSSRTINLDDRSGFCVYDIKVVSANGTYDQRIFNVCSESTFYFGS